MPANVHFAEELNAEACPAAVVRAAQLSIQNVKESTGVTLLSSNLDVSENFSAAEASVATITIESSRWQMRRSATCRSTFLSSGH